MKALLLVFCILSTVRGLSADGVKSQSPQTVGYELRFWTNASEVPTREPDIRARVGVDAQFFARYDVPSGGLCVLAGVLHAQKDGAHPLEFSFLRWDSAKSNTTHRSTAALELDKPYLFATGSSLITGHVLLLTRTRAQ